MSMYNPVPGSRTSSSYQGGFRRTGGHSGMDFAAASGTTAYAAVPGTVVSVGFNGAYGRTVKVQHQDGSIGYYAHLSNADVRVGQGVGRGSPIGRVGSTGNTTGPHLHFEVRRNGKPTDPTPWLSSDHNAAGTMSNQLSPGNFGGVKLNSEQLNNARTIMSVGSRMGANQRDLVTALMTAFQESRLRNLDYGDRDSLGLFQQRPSQGWGSSSQVRNPQYAAGKFFEGLFEVRGRNDMRLTEAAQAVQRSAFPDAYAKWESLARAVVGNPNSQTIPLYQHSRNEVFRDPADVFAGMDFMDDEPQGAAFGSLADSPTGNPAASPGDSVATSVRPAEPEQDEDHLSALAQHVAV